MAPGFTVAVPILYLFLATMAYADDLPVSATSKPRPTAVLVAPMSDSRGEAGDSIETTLSKRLLESKPLGYRDDNVLLPMAGVEETNAIRERRFHEAMAKLAEDRDTDRTVFLVIQAECGWHDGELVLKITRRPGGEPVAEFPLVRVAEAFDRIAAQTKFAILSIAVDGDVDRKDFARLSRICRLWNARTFPSTWLVQLRERDVPDATVMPLVDLVSAAADAEFGVDGYVTVREIAALAFGKEKRDKCDAFVWQTNRPGVADEATSLSAAAMLIAPVNFESRTQRLAALEKLHSEKQVDDPIWNEGRKLLDRMPPVAADRKLRRSLEDLLVGGIGIVNFKAIRDGVLAARALSVPKAKQFADSVLEANLRTRTSFVHANHASTALRAALQELLRRSQEFAAPQLRLDLEKLDAIGSSDLSNLLLKIRMQLGRRDDMSDRQILDTTLKSYAEFLDDYSDYFPPNIYAEEKKLNEGHFTGLGLRLQSAKRGGLEVVAVLANGGGKVAGILSGDRIVRVDEHSLLNLDFDDASNLLAGKPKQKARIWIERPGETGNLQFSVTFDRVQVETVFGWHRRAADQKWDFLMTGGECVGYIRIGLFSADTVDALRAALSDLRAKNAVGVILDLRDNPGGILNAAIETAGLFVGNKTVVEIFSANGERSTRTGTAFGSYRDIPMVVLINRNSASGAELVAAALSDHDRATIVGERSYGKGSVQSVFDLENGASALKITTELFRRPNGQPLNRTASSQANDAWGVTPDSSYATHFTMREMEQVAQRFIDDASAATTTDRNPKKLANEDRGVALAKRALFEKLAGKQP